MQEEIITLTFKIRKDEVKSKIKDIWASMIPMQFLIEDLILKADLKHYQKTLGI